MSALKGTGVGAVDADEVGAAPPPAVTVAVRVVPFSEVFALAAMLPVVLVLVNTLLADAVEEADVSAELEVTGASVVVVLGVSAETADVAGSDALAPDAGVSSALLEVDADPAPAPEDEPAVFDTIVAAVAPVEEAWM